jgi:hypothetical protein
MDNSFPSPESSPRDTTQAEAEQYGGYRYQDLDDELDLSASLYRGTVAIDRQDTGFGRGGVGTYIPGDEYDPFAEYAEKKKKDLYSSVDPSVNKVTARLSDMLLIPTSSTNSSVATPLEQPGQPQKYSLEPIPPYHEEYTSFTCDMDSKLPEAEMVHRVFEAVVSALNGKDLCNISSYKRKEHKNSIRGICYKNNTSAHWKMKVYKGRTTGDNTVLMVEFQRRQGSSISFHWFYTTLLQQETILALRKMKLEDAPTHCEGFMQPLPPPPMDLGDDGEAAQPTAEEQQREDLKDMDEEAVKALHAWASSEMVDQRREGLRVVVTLTESIPTQDAMVERRMPLIELLFDGLRCDDDEIQRLSSIALAQCAANPKLQEAISREFGKVVDVLKSLVSSLASPTQNYPLEAVDTRRHLTNCVNTLLKSDDGARMDPYKKDLSKLRLLTV